MFYACIALVICISIGVVGVIISLIDIDRFNFGLYLTLLSVVGTTIAIACWIVRPEICVDSPVWYDRLLTVIGIELSRRRRKRYSHHYHHSGKRPTTRYYSHYKLSEPPHHSIVEEHSAKCIVAVSPPSSSSSIHSEPIMYHHHFPSFVGPFELATCDDKDDDDDVFDYSPTVRPDGSQQNLAAAIVGTANLHHLLLPFVDSSDQPIEHKYRRHDLPIVQQQLHDDSGAFVDDDDYSHQSTSIAFVDIHDAVLI